MAPFNDTDFRGGVAALGFAAHRRPGCLRARRSAHGTGSWAQPPAREINRRQVKPWLNRGNAPVQGALAPDWLPTSASQHDFAAATNSDKR